ncbi:amino acid deaminase [Rheinheimera riviphila]|uniref:Amino acid deaminase n=1 Tax=Rheinheimera riviphila TaxID=1834037 RepID=A0A437QLX5_9GAMM|nr:amino acid deaminase [Rheinheimera riviphila]
MTLPIAVLDQQKLTNNIRWMQQFADLSGVQLAPHGKTGMLPALFLQQIAAGAWGMTLATVPQALVAAAHGVKRILLANQLVGRAEMQQVATMQQQGIEFYCLLDSPENLTQLDNFFSSQGLTLKVLLEIGVAGGRSGVRSFDAALELAQQVKHSKALLLAGVEFYEGVIKAPDQSAAIRQFIQSCIGFSLELQQQQLFATPQILLSGAGSAFYDLVSEAFQAAALPDNFMKLIRPGCYLFFDLGIYQQAQQDLLKRSALACQVNGELHNALEVWAYVLSRPEPQLAIIGFGKRDMAFDAGLPKVSQHFRPDAEPAKNQSARIQPTQRQPKAADARMHISKIMDQHALLQLPPDCDLAVGDMLSFAGSHPCLTLDKWRYVAVLDEDYQVRRWYETFF